LLYQQRINHQDVSSMSTKIIAHHACRYTRTETMSLEIKILNYTCVARARLLVTARSPLAESQIAAVASHTGPDAAHMRIVNSGWCSFVRAGHKTECMVSKNWGHDRHLYVSTMHHVQLTHASSRQCAHACLKI